MPDTAWVPTAFATDEAYPKVDLIAPKAQESGFPMVAGIRDPPDFRETRLLHCRGRFDEKLVLDREDERDQSVAGFFQNRAHIFAGGLWGSAALLRTAVG